jgi:hypothetical protein
LKHDASGFELSTDNVVAEHSARNRSALSHRYKDRVGERAAVLACSPFRSA